MGPLPPMLEQGLVWCRDRLVPWFLGCFAEVWQAITGHRLRTFLTTLGLALAVLVLVRLVPAVYGRFALAHDAANAARQVNLKGEDQVLWELRRHAFKLGLTEAALDPEVFSLETSQGEFGTSCTIAYDFIHVVPLAGTYRLRLRYQARITRLAVDPQPTGLPEETAPAVQ